MKYYCLCMSPAIDALVKLPRAPQGEGEIFKNITDTENVGGKALNVARYLAMRGATVMGGGLLGKDNAAPFEKELAQYGIKDCFVRVNGSTRRNEMITWPNGSTKINRSAFPQIAASDFTGIENLRGIDELEKDDIAIISGSLPQNLPPAFYAECIIGFKALGVKTVLDASGMALIQGIKSKPNLIKPNAEECEPLIGFIPHAPNEFIQATEILKRDCGHVIISDGANGAWFDGEFFAAPKVDVVDTTAAGDTLLAEWCYSQNPKIAVAAGSAACTMPGSQPPNLSLIMDLAK